MDDLLTTKQLQDLLQVDRITIYRMLSDGRLRGFKVGGQWRFSRREIEVWLQQQQDALNGMEVLPAEKTTAPSPRSLPLNCVEAIQAVCAEALDIAAVTTDLEGVPLTGVANSCAFCNLILSVEKGRTRCAKAWTFAIDGKIHTCHADLLCASASIEVGGHQVAITSGCQFISEAQHEGSFAWKRRIPALAEELGLDELALREASNSVRVVDNSYLERVSHLLQRVADTFSEIGEERLNLLSRLQHIAEMSRID